QPQRIVPRSDYHACPESQFREPAGQVADLHRWVGGGEVVAEVMLEHPNRAVAEPREELTIREHPLVELTVAGTRSSGGGYDAAELDSIATCHTDLHGVFGPSIVPFTAAVKIRPRSGAAPAAQALSLIMIRADRPGFS